MKIKIAQKLGTRWGLMLFFYILLLIRDIVGINIPLIVFSGVWMMGIFLWDDEDSAVFTLTSTICFANSVSITIPICAFFVMSFFRRKTIHFDMMMFVSVSIILIEMSKFVLFSDQNPKNFVNQSTIILLVGYILSNHFTSNCYEPLKFIKQYLFSFLVLSGNILILTIKQFGSVSALLSNSFRIGRTSFEGNAVGMTMSINANGIGVLAIVAIACTVLLIEKGKINHKFGIGLTVYFSLIGFMTVSKTFFLVYVITLILYIVTKLESITKDPIRTLIILGICLGGIVIFRKSQLYANIMLRFARGVAEGDLTTGRVDVTIEYLQIMQKSNHWLLGYGLQNITGRTGLLHATHNAVLEIFVTCGILGLVLYGFFFGTIARNAYVTRRNEGIKCSISNYLPIIGYLIYIQALQFLRISYIYGLIVVVVMAMRIRNFED